MEFGDFLRQQRKQKQLTTSQLAEMTGLSQSYISNLENGNRKTPKIESIMKLADGLGVDYSKLICLAGYVVNDVRLEYGDYDDYDDYDDYEENHHDVDERTHPCYKDKRNENEIIQKIDDGPTLAGHTSVQNAGSISTPNFYMDIDERYKGEGKNVPNIELHVLLTSNIGVSFNLKPLTDEDKKNIIKFIKTFIINRT